VEDEDLRVAEDDGIGDALQRLDEGADVAVHDAEVQPVAAEVDGAEPALDRPGGEVVLDDLAVERLLQAAAGAARADRAELVEVHAAQGGEVDAEAVVVVERGAEDRRLDEDLLRPA